MTAMQPSPQVILVGVDDCTVDPGNIRSPYRIPPDRILQLAASIKDSQQHQGGHFETGVERPICVYKNGHGQYAVIDGQERLLAVRHLRDTDPNYNYSGIPATVHTPPLDIGESTRFQMAQHNGDPVDPVSLVERAVELYNRALPDGSTATWKDVVRDMGGTPSQWSHYQNILNLTDALKQVVVNGEIRPQNAAIIGRDLPEKDLQTRFHRDLVAEGKSKPRLEAKIQEIRRLIAIEPALGAKGEDTYEVSEDDEETNVVPVSGIDREATFLLNQVFKALTRLEIIGGEGRLSGTAGEIDQAIERLQDLRNYAD